MGFAQAARVFFSDKPGVDELRDAAPHLPLKLEQKQEVLEMFEAVRPAVSSRNLTLNLMALSLSVSVRVGPGYLRAHPAPITRR